MVLCLSDCLPSVSLSRCVPVFMYLTCRFVCLLHFLYVCLSLCLPACQSVCLLACLHVLSVPVLPGCLPVTLSVCTSVSVLLCPARCLTDSFSVCFGPFRACRSVSILFACLGVCPVCLSGCLYAGFVFLPLPAWLVAFLHVCASVCVHISFGF